MKRAAVMMSTYNGEKYLRQQLDSILSQRDVDVTLYIRDDGSTDSTIKIVEEYMSANKNIRLIVGENVGVGNSFMNLVYAADGTYDYYAFADQDDVWCENKLAEAIACLQTGTAWLYVSNQELTDKAGGSLGLRYNDEEDMYTNAVGIVSRNKFSGCTMVFNRELYALLSKEANRPSEALLKNRIHDVWVAAVAAISGGIYYDKRSFIKYRQHENNVVGVKKSTRLGKLKMQFKKLSDKKLRNGRSMLAAELCEKFPQYTTGEELVRIAADRKHKRRILKHGKEFRHYTGESRTEFFLKVVFGLF